jgi:hypothetical protein
MKVDETTALDVACAFVVALILIVGYLCCVLS